MNSLKDWLKWTDKIDDSEINNILDKEKELLKKPSKKTYDIILKDINSYKSEKTKKTTYKINNIFFNNRPVLAFSFILVIVIIFFSLFFSVKYYLSNLNKNDCYISSINGNVLINNKSKVNKDMKLKEKSVISTQKNSTATITLGTETFVNLNEKTNLELKKLYKDSNKKITEIIINNGKVNFKVEKLNKLSSFKVKTKLLDINIVGTEFDVHIKQDQTNVNLIEGSIEIVINYNKIKELEDLEKTSKELSKIITEELTQKIIIKPNENITITEQNIISIEKNIKNLILNINEYHSDEEKIKKEIIKYKMEQININKNIIEKKDKSNNDNIEQEKLNEKNYNLDIKIFSPKYKYYDYIPELSYEVLNEDNIKLYLNNRFITDSEKLNVKTGYNTFKIEASNEKSKLTKEIIFFVNDKKLSYSEHFKGQHNFKKTYSTHDNLYTIENEQLVSNGNNEKKSFCMFFKIYEKEIKNIIEKIDIIEIGPTDNNFINIQLGLEHINGKGALHTSILKEKKDNEYQYFLFFEEWLAENNKTNIFKANKITNFDFSESSSLIFYRKNSHYICLLIDKHNNILNSIDVKNPPIENNLNEFKRTKILLNSGDLTKNINGKIVLDNFYIYKQ